MYSRTPLDNFSDEQLVHITQICFEYCYRLFGLNNKKRNPISVCIYDYSSPNEWGDYIKGKKMGEYCPTTNEIRLFKDGLKNLGEFTSTFLHEYTHSTQPILTKYSKLVKEYSYDNHPLEVEARLHEKLHNRKLLNHIRKCYTK